jgi:hypothetical protein
MGRKRTKSIFEGIYVVCKFFLSKAPDGKLNCISRTLGKFSIVDKRFDGVVENQELWVCRIMKEIKPGENNGAFVLKPVERIKENRLRKIIPGFYELHLVGNAAMLVPNTDPADCWMLSATTRKIYAKRYYATVVPVAYSEALRAG